MIGKTGEEVAASRIPLRTSDPIYIGSSCLPVVSLVSIDSLPTPKEYYITSTRIAEGR